LRKIIRELVSLMMEEIKTPEYDLVKKRLEELKARDDAEIIIRKHASSQIERRGLDEERIRSLLKEPERLKRADKQDEGKFKAHFQISRKYSMVIVLRLNNPNIYIITAYKTSKKWQKQAKKARK